VGYNEEGFCDDSTDPFGAAVEIDVGAEIGLEAWKEVDGKKDVFFNHVIFSNYEVLELPDICISFGGAPEGSCLPEDMNEATAEWFEIEVEQEEEVANFAVATAADVSILASRKKKDPAFEYYSLDCDPKNESAGDHSTYPIKPKSYPIPSELTKDTPSKPAEAGRVVPIMKLGIQGCKNPTNIDACVPEKWTVTQSSDKADMEDGVTKWNSKSP